MYCASNTCGDHNRWKNHPSFLNEERSRDCIFIVVIVSCGIRGESIITICKYRKLDFDDRWGVKGYLDVD